MAGANEWVSLTSMIVSQTPGLMFANTSACGPPLFIQMLSEGREAYIESILLSSPVKGWIGEWLKYLKNVNFGI